MEHLRTVAMKPQYQPLQCRVTHEYVLGVLLPEVRAVAMGDLHLDTECPPVIPFMGPFLSTLDILTCGCQTTCIP